MENQKDSAKKKDTNIILDSVINRCVIDISKRLNEQKDEKFNFFDAFDKVFELYDLEQEILINYEEEIIKSGLKNKDLGLDPKQVDIIKDKIKDQLYKNYLEKFENKSN